MRYLPSFVFVLALGVAPLRVSAQDAEEGTTSESNLQEPALQLKLDAAGVDVVPSAPRTTDGYIVANEEMVLRERVSKARAWLIATAVVTAIGVPLLAVGATYDRRQQPSQDLDLDFTGAALGIIGGVMVAAGVVGMVASGAELGASKRKLRALQQAHYGTPRRVQWDLAQSRLVF